MVLVQTKRRRISVYSLPVVVAIGFLLVAKLAALQRSDLIADLTDCVAHGETREAIDAVRKLAAMPNPPIATLVAAAAADEHETAEAGQVSISRLLRRWQRDIEMKHRLGVVASQLSELADTLAEKQNDFSNADHAWLATTARKIMRLANKFPAKKTPMVAIHCDAILTAIDGSATAPQMAPIARDSASFAKEKAKNGAVKPTTAVDDRALDRANLEQEFSALAPQAPGQGSHSSEHGNEKRPTSANVVPIPTPPDATESILDSDDDTANATSDSPPANDAHNRSVRVNDESAERVWSRHDPSWRADSSQSILRLLPAMPVNALPIEASASKEVTAKSRSAAPSGRPALRAGVAANEGLAGVDSRDLLRRWLSAENGDVQPIEQELAKRGFGQLTTRLVRQFFSDDAEERMRLVDDLIAQPGAGAGAWLLMLAEDSDAEVRLFAVTLMATSNDAALMEKAWQVALRDRDPRIADLAGRLRERRTGTLRR